MSPWVLRSVAAAAGLCVGLSLYLAVIGAAGQAAGWCEVAIASAGIPVLVSELLNLRRRIDEGNRRPRIAVGLAQYPLSLADIEDPPPATITLERKAANFHVSLVLRNTGSLAAKSLKIHLIFDSYQANTNVPHVYCPEGAFVKQGEKDYFSTVGADWLVRPGDAEWFHFELTPHPSGQIRSGTYRFTCIVWADRLDQPVNQQLEVRIAR
jgi:hypothetical protein